MKEKIQFIRLFKDQPPEVCDYAESHAIIQNYQKDEIVLWQQDDCENVYFILNGYVEIFQLSYTGREQIINRLTRGDCFNLESACCKDALHPANARVLVDSQLLLLCKTDFLQMARMYPTFCLAVTNLLAERLCQMMRLVESLSLYSVDQRLAKFLIDQADSAEISMKWTQTDMARMIGTVREVVGRALRKFEKQGMIRIDRNRILLLNRRRLENWIGGKEETFVTDKKRRNH